MEARHRASGARASASGTIAIVDNGPRLDLSGSWNDFRWPLGGRDVAVRSAAGSFTLRGVLPYAVHLRGSGRAAQPAGDAGRAARHAGQGQLQLRSGGGRPVRRSRQRQRSRGVVAARRPGRSLAASPASTRARCARICPAASASRSRLTAAASRPRSDLSVSFSSLSGKLRGVAASGSGTVTHSGSDLGLQQRARRPRHGEPRARRARGRAGGSALRRGHARPEPARARRARRAQGLRARCTARSRTRRSWRSRTAAASTTRGSSSRASMRTSTSIPAPRSRSRRSTRGCAS